VESHRPVTRLFIRRQVADGVSLRLDPHSRGPYARANWSLGGNHHART